MAKVGDRFVRKTSKGLILSELKVVRVNEKSMFLEDWKGKIYRKSNTDSKTISIKQFSDSKYTENYFKLED